MSTIVIFSVRCYMSKRKCFYKNNRPEFFLKYIYVFFLINEFIQHFDVKSIFGEIVGDFFFYILLFSCIQEATARARYIFVLLSNS